MGISLFLCEMLSIPPSCAQILWLLLPLLRMRLQVQSAQQQQQQQQLRVVIVVLILVRWHVGGVVADAVVVGNGSQLRHAARAWGW